MALERTEKQRIALEAGRVFSPAAPIDESALFAGRREQLRQVLDAINQRGQHAIIYGERGVGKTSLANVLAAHLSAPSGLLAPHVNCDGADGFSSVWKKVFAEIELSRQVLQIGFRGELLQSGQSLAESLPETISSADVRRVLTLTSPQAMLILIVDEFDRLRHESDRSLFADTIKMLSDHALPATLVLVGVADTVDELIREHQSIERALVQVHMPRMSADELHEIVLKGLARLGMEIRPEALSRISLLSRGLPHYTHLLGRHAARQALDAGELAIGVENVDAAIAQALDQAQQSIRSAYHRATTSPRKDSLYAQVLLACAMAPTDDMGYFAAADVRGPMTEIMGKPYGIPSFARHLNDFCDERRGSILQKTGMSHRFRYRFRNPLMQPFVTMQGLMDGRIPAHMLQRPMPERPGPGSEGRP
jgi:Cdc6-like AAA superfamily ATPase